MTIPLIKPESMKTSLFYMKELPIGADQMIPGGKGAIGFGGKNSLFLTRH